MEEEAYGLVGAISSGGYDPTYAAQRKAADAARAQVLQAARAQGAYAQSATLNAPAPLGMTERIGMKLSQITSTLSRAHNTLTEKHVALFGYPAPSGVAELRKGAAGEVPSNAEATITTMLELLADRASDLEAAAESMASRL